MRGVHIRLAARVPHAQGPSTRIPMAENLHSGASARKLCLFERNEFSVWGEICNNQSDFCGPACWSLKFLQRPRGESDARGQEDMLLKQASGSKYASGQGPVARKEATLGTSHRGDLIQGGGYATAGELVEDKGTPRSPRDKKCRTQLPSLGLGGYEGRLIRASETYQGSGERVLRTLRRACGRLLCVLKGV